MQKALNLAIIAVICGAILGSTLGYLEARIPASSVTSVSSKTPSPESTPTANKGPIAQIPERTFNFNVIERGTSMKHVFKIRNIGDQPLTLKVESTTCKCTAGELSKDKVLPGDEAEIELEFTAKVPPSPFRHGATLSSNDPSNSRIELVVEGDVVESTTVEPSELLFGTVKTGATQTASLFLTSHNQEEVKVTDYELSAKDLEDSLTIKFDEPPQEEIPDKKAKGVLRVTATFKGSKRLGPFFSWLELHTNLEKAEKITVPVSGNVVGDISAFGPGWIAQKNLLNLDAIKGSEGRKVLLTLVVRGDQASDTQLNVASVDPPELKVTLGDKKQLSEELAQYPLRIEIPAGTRPMIRMTRGEDDDPVNGDGEIVLSSNHPENSEFRIRVRFSVE